MPASPNAAILRRLREAGGSFTPGSDLGDPPAVARRISGLIDAGYRIEHQPGLGYCLLASPDRLIADDIFSRLPEKRWTRDILVFESTGSTNDVINGMARNGAPAGAVAFAEQQTAGRGRLGRRWQSDGRLGLWFSMLLRPQMPVAQWPRLTLWIAYALAQGIRQFTGLRVALKWPNDLHASGRKLAGILVESSHGENGFATAGIGLNVNHPSFSPPLDSIASSLRLETGAPIDRNALAATLLASFDQSYSLIPNRFDEIVAWASEADCLRGRRVSATAGMDVQEGIAGGLDPEGALLIRTAAGGTVRVTSGEVTCFSAAAE